MRHRVSFVTICFLGAMLLQAGCGSDPGTVTTEKQTDVFAADVKNVFNEYLAYLKETSDPSHIDMMLEFFDDNEFPDSDSNQATYDKLKAGATELKSMFGNKASKADINKKIDELLALALTLPGELEDFRE